MNKETFFIILFLLIGNNISLSAQDPVFSQFYNTPTNLNPAFTGNFDAPVFAVNYRNQWSLIQNAYSTYSFSYDQFFRKYKSGFGIFLLSDSAGDGAMKTINASLLYSYSININDDYRVKFGIEAGLIQTRIDWEKFVFSDNLHPQYGVLSPGGTPYPSKEIKPADLSTSNMDISTGLLLFSKKLYFGIAFKHLNNPPLSVFDTELSSQDVGLPMRWTFHGGGQITIRDNEKNKEGVFISPNFLFTKQGDFIQINAGVYMQMSQLITGVWLRHAYSNIDALILAAGWKYDMYKFVYSFDFSLSKLGSSSGGSHEIGIIINLDKIYPEKSRSIECFEVFR